MNDKDKKKKVTKRFTPKKPPKKIDELPDAIQDRKMLAPVGATVILRRDHRPDRLVSVCEVSKIQDDGNVLLWDETQEQWFFFNLNDANVPTLKLTA